MRNRLVYSYTVAGRLRPALAAQPADGTGDVEQFGDGFEAAVSRSGEFMLFAGLNEDADVDLFYRGPGDATPKLLLHRAGAQNMPQLSPDAAYLAYQSNESGRYEVYVRPFPAGTGQWQVSTGGGSEPRWSRKGDKLWFRAFGNVLMEVDVTTGATFTLSEPRAVFEGDPVGIDLTLGYAVLGDGDRFIATRRMPDLDGSSPGITVVQNWLAEFAARR
jgi:serine/threonine-protein kinase